MCRKRRLLRLRRLSTMKGDCFVKVNVSLEADMFALEGRYVPVGGFVL